jgi:hypothetical protein
MSWRAKIFDAVSGRFVAAVTVMAESMDQAERVAISRACLALRGDPARMEVRHLHQLTTGGAR